MCGICAKIENIVLSEFCLQALQCKPMSEAYCKSQGRHLPSLRGALCPRGPDSFDSVTLKIPCASKDSVETEKSNEQKEDKICHEWTEQDTNLATVTMAGAVLHLRGEKITPQPLSNEDAILVWNGEIFDGTLAIGTEDNDTAVLFKELSRCINDSSNSKDQHAAQKRFSEVWSGIEGPFALIYWDKRHQCLYFGRDRLGRRSLLYHYDHTHRTFYLSSAAHSETECVQSKETESLASLQSSLAYHWQELPCLGVYQLEWSPLGWSLNCDLWQQHEPNVRKMPLKWLR
ncbi:hypothetical protein RFI_22011 [Reticulomyxa filosa]|uniref:Glutamine amidotransferase type-2 domain-containing protein n=1 Tax=Reticulomyxa filosa TaxID=46433 RepID=X6MNW4_RETFI|nr:hypothetical protein RFI_22011 [Reticulomyxa filosa]|eukprot:ETO15346.1 hypothetical protein RFI_22011 [Reticulomyxa filosa]